MVASQTQIRQQQTWQRMVYKLVDVIAIGLGLLVLFTWIPSANSDGSIVSFLLACAIFNIAAEFFGLYRNWQGVALESEIRSCFLAWATSLLVLVVVGFFSTSTTELTGSTLIVWFGVTPVFSLAGRISIRLMLYWFVDNGVNTREYAIVGANDLGVRLAKNIEESPALGLRFAGFYDDRPENRTAELPEQHSRRLGNIDDLVRDAKQLQVDTVFIALPMRAEERIRQVINALSDTTISAYVVPDLFVFQLLHSRWSDVQGVPVVSIFENPLYGVDGVLKRINDVILATIGIVFAAIPMMLIAAIIKATSRGPVFFRQRRYGLDGREFHVWKFRSMTVCEDGATIKQATQNDLRVTTFGNFLRRSSLDELPQLFNVLNGSMSLVGPRPHATAHNEQYRKQITGYMLRHKIKPGITGLAQIKGFRGETDTLYKMEKRIEFDHQYIREWSMWMDFRIIFKTFGIVFSQQNAH